MLNENNGLIRCKLLKAGLFQIFQSDNYKNLSAHAMFSNSYWDSNEAVLPAWFKIDFSVLISFSEYSFKIPFIDRRIESWSVFDSRGEEIDRHENDTVFSTKDFSTFQLNKRVTTSSLKIIFNKTKYRNVAYISYFDIDGSIDASVKKYFKRLFNTKRCSSFGAFLFLMSITQTVSS